MTTSELTEIPSSPEQTSTLMQMGATSIAECRWEDDRKVFVKRLRQELADDERYRDAFRKEFEIGKTFDCPRLVRYIRMDGDSIIEEYVDGVTLDVFISENPEYYLHEANLRTMLLELLEGLAYLHERQILHLDLKPANIIITQIGNHVKIVDFGFSYTDSFVMSPGGTKGFAAPEQLSGSAGLNVTADIYAVGRILMYLDEELGLSRKYRSIAEKCCQENPEDRFASVDEIRNALEPEGHFPNFFLIVLIFCTTVCAGVYFFCNNRQKVSDDVFCINGIHYTVTSDSTLRVVRPDTTGAELDLIIPENVTFHGHTYSVTSIDSCAYLNCEGMIAMTLPNSIDSIGYKAFADCHNITNVYIPDNVSFIEQDAFQRCERLKAVRLPSGISTLERGVFSLCHGLEEIDVPANVKVLKQDLFGECLKLHTIHLHEGLEVIERGVFWECRSLTSLTIPSTVREIGDYAFWGCSSMTDLYMKSKVPPRVTKIFKGLHLRIHVPKEAEQNYKEAVSWKDQEIIAE